MLSLRTLIFETKDEIWRKRTEELEGATDLKKIPGNIRIEMGEAKKTWDQKLG